MEDTSGDNQHLKPKPPIKDLLLKVWSNITSPSDSLIDPTIRFQAWIVTITILVLIVMVVLSVMAQSDLSPEGKVFVHGELWNAEASESIPKGSKVKVIEVLDTLKIKVAKV